MTLRCSTHREMLYCVWKNPQGHKIRPLPDDRRYSHEYKDDHNCDLTIVSANHNDAGEWECEPIIRGLPIRDGAKGKVVVIGK